MWRELGAYGYEAATTGKSSTRRCGRKSLYFGAGTYRFSKPLELDGQNIAGVSFWKNRADVHGKRPAAPDPGQGVCGIRDMTLSFDKAVMTGQEKEGENVAIWLGGQKRLEPGSYVRNICLNQCGTAVYAPGNLRKRRKWGLLRHLRGAEFLPTRGLTCAPPGRAGNTYTNIYCGAAYDNDTKALSDAGVFALGGAEVAPSDSSVECGALQPRQPIVFSNLRISPPLPSILKG